MAERRTMKFIMKTCLGVVLLSSLLLTSCKPKPQVQDVSTETLAFVYTSLAETALAQVQAISTNTPVQPTATPVPPATETPTIPPTASATPNTPVAVATSACDNAAYVADVTFPDNTVLAPDTKFEKTWTLKNTGTCSWNKDYRLIFVDGSAMSGQNTNISGPVAPGSTINVTVAMTSPHDDGTYTGYWRMMNDKGVRFGGSVTVVIKVSSKVTSTPTITSTGTITTTPTQTPTTGNTSTPTPTTENSATPTPTTENTATPTETQTETATPTETPTETPTPTFTPTS
jgi:hypothetical protein